jgi:hypothetical protein
LRYVPFLDQIATNLSNKNVGVSRLRSVGAVLPKDYETIRNVDSIYQFRPEDLVNMAFGEALPHDEGIRELWKLPKKKTMK